MGKLLAGIDYSPASIQALTALLPLRQAMKYSLSLYHAYQLPKGLPFLSAHVIEDMEMDAQREAQKKLRQFLHTTLPDDERRHIHIITEREFLTEGLSRYLATGKYNLLALGARGEVDANSEPIGFHARHFIQEAPVPVLITFPHTEVQWKRLLLAYEANYRSPVGQRFLRQLTQKLNLPVVGLPIVSSNSTTQQLHKKIQRLVQTPKYHPVVWRGAAMVRLLLQAARTYEADVIAYFGEPSEILQGMRSMPETELDGGAAWLFFPQRREPSAETENKTS